MTDKITKELLKQWNACSDGYKRFNKLFPDGADLKTAIEGLKDDNHIEWAEWLFFRCRENKLFKEITDKGFENSGDWNSGDWNSGDWNSGNRNSGNRNSGNWNSGNWNSGNWNSGDWNSGNRNSGNWNSGDWNSGNRNSGDRNSGNRNSGNRNSGDWNSGNRNSGNWNSGNWNSGDWNSGDWNSGFFNTITPEDILVFNKPCKRSDWESAKKPDFIFFDLTYWVSENDMTDEDKKADPNFYIRGGQLRKRTYQEAWRLSFEKATKEDIEMLKKLPNFDAELFFEISGIRVS